MNIEESKRRMLEIKESKKNEDVIAYSEYQVKDFANWCIRVTNEQDNMFKKWVLEGPNFLFNEWKNHREL